MGLLLRAGETDSFTTGVTSPLSFSLGARILGNLPFNWPAVGVTSDADLRSLAEILMRLFVSFMRYPSTPPLTDDQLRALVRRWIGPALRG